jgi:hypothetical protein
MVIALSVAVLLSPLVFTVLLTSSLSNRVKIVVSALILFLMITVPLVYLLVTGGG